MNIKLIHPNHGLIDTKVNVHPSKLAAIKEKWRLLYGKKYHECYIEEILPEKKEQVDKANTKSKQQTWFPEDNEKYK
jgi:hypothetical protein